MSVIINNASLLLGRELAYVERGHVVIEKGKIKSAGKGPYNGTGKAIDGRGFLIMPGFINAHTHVADSIGKDIAAGNKLDERVHPVLGAKKKILEKTTPDHLKVFVRNTAVSMMKKGIVAFADFREGGPAGIKLLRDALAGLPIKCVALGRTGYYSTPEASGDIPLEHVEEAKEVIRISEGLGVSGANENNDVALARYRNLADNKLLAIHAAESRETALFSKQHTGLTEVQRIMLRMKPDFVVHMTNASDEDTALVAENHTGIVLCPRANGVLGAGIPRVARMLGAGCTVALGTDNVMLNSPDMTRELDYLWKVSRVAEAQMIDPREMLRMATVNGADILKLNSGCIEEGRSADLLFIDKRHGDLYPMHDPHAALVHRLSQSSITSVMIDGRFAEALN